VQVKNLISMTKLLGYVTCDCKSVQGVTKRHLKIGEAQIGVLYTKKRVQAGRE